MVALNTTLSNNTYQSSLGETITVQATPIGPDGKPVSGIESDLKITQSSGTGGLVSFPSTFVEINNSGIYEATYRGDKLGAGKLEVAHELIKPEIDIEIVPVAKVIDVKASGSTDRQGNYQLLLTDTLNLEIKPFDDQGQLISGITNTNWTINAGAALNCNQAINENGAGTGVYITTCSTAQTGLASVSVSYQTIQDVINVNVYEIVVAGFDVKVGTPLNSTSGDYESVIGQTIDLQIIPVTAQGHSIPNLAPSSFTIVYQGTQSAVTIPNLTESNIAGVYTTTYTGNAPESNNISIDYNAGTPQLIPVSFITRIVNIGSATMTPTNLQIDTLTSTYDSVVDNAIDLTITVQDDQGQPVSNIDGQLILEYGGSNTFDWTSAVETGTPGTYIATYTLKGKGGGNLKLKYNNGELATITLKGFEVWAFESKASERKVKFVRVQQNIPIAMSQIHIYPSYTSLYYSLKSPAGGGTVSQSVGTCLAEITYEYQDDYGQNGESSLGVISALGLPITCYNKTNACQDIISPDLPSFIRTYVDTSWNGNCQVYIPFSSELVADLQSLNNTLHYAGFAFGTYSAFISPCYVVELNLQNNYDEYQLEFQEGSLFIRCY